MAGVEFKSQYLKWYYKWLEIVELEHSEEGFLLYLRDCYITKYPDWSIQNYGKFRIIYTGSYHRVYYRDKSNNEWDYLDSLMDVGKYIIEQYENT